MDKEPRSKKAFVRHWLWIILLQLITLAFILLIRYPLWVKALQQMIMGIK